MYLVADFISYTHHFERRISLMEAEVEEAAPVACESRRHVLNRQQTGAIRCPAARVIAVSAIIVASAASRLTTCIPGSNRQEQRDHEPWRREERGFACRATQQLTRVSDRSSGIQDQESRAGATGIQCWRRDLHARPSNRRDAPVTPDRGMRHLFRRRILESSSMCRSRASSAEFAVSTSS